MANTKKASTPNKSGARCCSSKKSESGVQASVSTTKNSKTTRTQSKKTGTTK